MLGRDLAIFVQVRVRDMTWVRIKSGVTLALFLGYFQGSFLLALSCPGSGDEDPCLAF